jgi:hypothetical protein
LTNSRKWRKLDFMPTLAEFENPYASLNAHVDVEEELAKHDYVKRQQNPYAAVEVFGECHLPDSGESKSNGEGGQQLGLPSFPEVVSATKTEFRKRCRSILLPYEPMRGKNRVLRPEFREFIKENEDKLGTTRAAIISELERFDLSSMGALNPHLNREGDSLAKKLSRISQKHSS